MQSVEEKGKKAVQDCEARLTPMQREVEGILGRVELQTGKDDATMQEHRETLSSISAWALDTVHNFISSELRQDLPTGMREAEGNIQNKAFWVSSLLKCKYSVNVYRAVM